jgi:dTMP kinase
MAGARFITFEGGEGSGKSTQARLLADRLRAVGRDVVPTREPGGSPFAESLRALILDARTPPHSALSEALLFYAARADHLAHTIRPALAAGRWVICDRFSDSSRVYQGVAGALPMATLDALERLVVAPTVPDLTIVVDVPVEVGLARADARRRPHGGVLDPYEARTREFHEKLRAGFLAIARAEPARCAVVDGAQPAETVAAAVWAIAAARLNVGAS